MAVNYPVRWNLRVTREIGEAYVAAAAARRVPVFDLVREVLAGGLAVEAEPVDERGADGPQPPTLAGGGPAARV